MKFTWKEQDETGVQMRAVLAETLAMFLFIIIGCGTACGHGAVVGETFLDVALAFGIGITVLAYTIGKYSGGQINCAVTFSLILGGQLSWCQGLANMIGQLIGSIAGAVVLAMMYPCADDKTGGLGSNVIADGDEFKAFIGEILGTFILCYVVWETAVSPKSTAGPNACIAIGFAVFLSHLVLLPIDGCSINPTRSFGPAVVASFRSGSCAKTPKAEKLFSSLVIVWIAPLLGGGLATGMHKVMTSGEGQEVGNKEETTPLLKDQKK